MNHFYDDNIMFKLKKNNFTHFSTIDWCPKHLLQSAEMVSAHFCDSESLSCVITFWLTVLVYKCIHRTKNQHYLWALWKNFQHGVIH